MTSFNDGIEAAAQWMEELAKQAATVAGLREYAENCQISAQNIRALKRPEPSEAEKAELAARAIFHAVDPTSGDTIGCTLSESQFITGETLTEQMEQVMGICRAAARAAFAAAGGEA